MPKPAFISRTVRIALIALLAVAGSAVAVSTATGGSIKPKNGAYYQVPKPGQAFGYVNTEAGRITGGGGSLAFRDKAGKSCAPEGLSLSEGKVSFSFEAKRKVRPNSRNRFVISIKRSSYSPTVRGTVSGKMLSRNRATLTLSLSAGNCKAKATFSKAVFTAGG